MTFPLSRASLNLMKPTSFVFVRATFKPQQRQALFSYRIDFKDQASLNFQETLQFPAGKVKTLSPALLKKFLQDLHLMLGISYYKLYTPTHLDFPYALNKEEAQFWTTVYQKGLGEFFYRNKLSPKGRGVFKTSSKAKPFLPLTVEVEERALLGIGGGKDSIVAGELLKERKLPCTAFVLETQKDSPVVDEVIKTMGLKKLVVKRSLDPQLFTPLPGSTNGHIPISAIFALVGTFTAALYGYRYIVVANEASSNFGNIQHKGQTVNHQWSKSAEFEALLQKHLKNTRSPSVNYFSAIRHFYEIRTVESFVRYPKYFPIFTSCNRNFRVHRKRPGDLWCGECPKCAFVFTQLSAFLPPKKLTGFFGKNLFEKPELQPLFKDLCGLGKLKPFDCVGTFEETRAALRRASKQWGKTALLKTLLPLLHKNFPKDEDDELFKVQDAPTLPAHFKFLGLKNVLLLGYGKEGEAAHRYLKKYYPQLLVRIGDQSKNPHYLDVQEKSEFAIKTPGLPKQKVRIPYTTGTNIFFAQQQSFTVGVTGSKGKSTTASLVAHLLQSGGVDAELLGNIGKPMLEVLLKPTPAGRIYVLELSSYQLDDCTSSPNMALVTNLFPEHMTYHGGVEPYYAAKKNIFLHQSPTDLLILNPRHALLKKWLKEAPGSTAAPSQKRPPVSPLLGEHNRSNIALALRAAEQFKIPEKTLFSALRSFKALPHRLEDVGTFCGLHFYDDAISTSPESTIEAINALSPLAPIGTIFLGGEDRGYDFTALEKTLRQKKIKNLVLFPETGARMLKSTKGFKILRTTSMKEAVQFAYKNTPVGQIVLLSTASPSYSLWKNFEAKGQAFQKEVKKGA